MSDTYDEFYPSFEYEVRQPFRLTLASKLLSAVFAVLSLAFLVHGFVLPEKDDPRVANEDP